MFFVINKDKLFAYVVSVVTVVMLFMMAGIFMPNNNTIETSSNIQKNELKESNNTTDE